MYWALKGFDPYNRIGKRALQDVYSWSTRGLIKYRIIYGPQPHLDLIKIEKVVPQVNVDLSMGSVLG